MIITSHTQDEKLSKANLHTLVDRNKLLNNANNKADQLHQTIHLELPSCTCDACSSRGSTATAMFMPPTITQKFACALRTNALIISRLFRNPLFIILCITHVSFTWGWTTYSMVIVDFAVDRGTDFFSAVTLLSAFSFSDLIGRLGSGWISDKGFIKRRNVAFASILSIGLLLWMLPIAQNFTVLLANALALGLFSGSLMILFSILLVEYVGIETMPVALGTSTFCCGVATLFRPIVIGMFRDQHGSYEGLFQFLGISCVLVALLWLVEPCAQLWQERRDRIEKTWEKVTTKRTMTSYNSPPKRNVSIKRQSTVNEIIKRKESVINRRPSVAVVTPSSEPSPAKPLKAPEMKKPLAAASLSKVLVPPVAAVAGPVISQSRRSEA